MKVPSSILAPLVVMLFLGTLWIGSAWELPSMERTFADAEGEARTADFIVEGLRCRGTSSFFIAMIQEVPGVLSATTYVQEHRATIKYDPSRIDPAGIAEAIGRPVRLRDGRMVAPFKVIETRE